MLNKTKVIGFFGGPGLGKSTQAAETFVLLKKAGINCELVTEYAKDLTWQNSFAVLENQIYVFAKQHQKMFRLRGKVDVIITDSPLITGLIYLDPNNEHFKDSYEYFRKLVLSEFNHYDNYNFLLKRETVYQTVGRNQDEESAKKIDEVAKKLLIDNKISYESINLIGAAQYVADKFLK